jgi:hypothetical protein
VRPVNAIETSTGVPLVCGRYSFAVYTDTSDTALSAAWLVVAEKAGSPGTYVMTADTTVDITLLTTTATQTYNVQIKAWLDDYTYIKTYTAKSVQITAATCVCSHLRWDAPTKATPTFAVAATGTPTLTPPVVNKGAQATVAAFDSCYKVGTPAPGCAETGKFNAGSIKYDDGVTAGGTTLPTWISFSSSGVVAQTLTIAPPNGGVNGQHTLFATFTPDNGSAITYTVMTFTVTCTLTDYTMPSAPVDNAGGFDLSYIVFDGPLSIDMASLTWTEVPTCSYAATQAITWTGLQSSFMTQNTVNPSLITISTSDKTKATNSPYTVTYKRQMTVTASGQTGTTVFRGASGDVLTFQITVTDPCVTATITDPTLASISVSNGATATQDFTEATDSVDAAQSVKGLCGDRNYAVMDGNTGTPAAVSWITVTKDTPTTNTHRITASPANTALVTGSAHSYYLKTTYAEYSSHAGKFTALSV